MSKKMWHKIFKSKAQKQQQQLNKINKRHSRGIYEEYQQLNELLNGEKSQAARFCSENENENGNSNGSSYGGNINVFEQQPQQSSFNSSALSEAQQQPLQQQQLQQQQQQQQQQQTQQLSTFSRVRNTFSLRRSSNNNNNSNNNKQTINAKSSESDTPTPTPTAVQHVLIIVNQIDVAAAATVATATTTTTTATATTTTNTATNHANHLHVQPATAIASTTMESDGADDDQNEPLGPPPPPLTTGMSETIQEEGVTSSTLTPCPCCSRTFNVNALRKHVIVCEKTSKKRKIFDSSRQRREGTSLSTYVLPKNFGLPNAEKASGVHTPPAASREASSASLPQVASPQPTRRKAQGNTLRRNTGPSTSAAAAAAAAVAPPAAAAPAAAPVAAPAPAAAAPLSREGGVRASGRSITKRIKEAAGERCPHCERTFNAKAYDRHVEWCKEKAIQANIKLGNTTETSKAKERMEARKQYRPPNLKTKRSINRDKYSGAQDEQYEPEMVSPKQNLMSLSMTSSVHSDNPQRNAQQSAKVPRPGTPQAHSPQRKSKSHTSNTTTITQNKVSLRMAAEDANAGQLEQAYVNPKRKQHETCQEIDVAMQRLRRTATSDALQLAKLDCAEAAPLQPARSRRTIAHRPKVDPGDALAGPPQVTMTFEELNGLIKRKGGTNICNIKMDIEDQEMKVTPKMRSATSLVRQARRRIRTRENPNIDIRSLEPPMASGEFDLSSKEMILASDRMSSGMYSGSEDEANSPRGEIQIKMETSTYKAVCRPKKRSHLPPIMNSSEPMRALPMAELKQNLEALNQNFLPRLEPKSHYKEQHDEDLDDLELDELDYDEADREVGQLLSKAKLLDSELDDELDEAMYSEEEQDSPVPVKMQSLRHTPSNVSRRLVLLEQDAEGTMYIKAPPSPSKRQARSPPNVERSLVHSGLSPLASDKYDPFLSAKRQLEELCSPNTPPDNEPTVTGTTATPIMSTSLTSTLGKLHTTTTTTTPQPSSTAPKPAPTSNFRRTSSLRGPRRTPLLPSRPLFATNYRPTIQRGLSDEGPISSNFLKPEEYDEMPVRAVCGNDFHSPRVVRRDTSASNRKQQMKLPLGGAAEVDSATVGKQLPGRNVAKTDSLAVFLKYEHELEQLNAKAAEVAAISKELSSKELKDKSNNLSKQNSAKNLTANANGAQLPPLATPICPPVAKENNENVAHNYATPLRLEPIVSKPLQTLPTPNSSSGGSSSNAAAMPIKLESIFGNNRLGDYIDPKLINPCDNLHVQQSSTGSSEASSTPQQISQSRSSSQSTITMAQEQRRHSGEARNLLKRKMRLGRNQFLYDASPEEAYISSGSCADDEANRSSLEFDEQCWQQQQKQLLSNPITMPLTMPNMPVLPTFDDFDFEEFLSSFENENDEEQFPLFRDCREFLLNRTTSRQRSFQKATSTTTPQTQSQTTTHTQPATPTATQRPATTGSSAQFITPPKSHYYAPTTKEIHAHRSDSNVSSSGGSFKSPVSSGSHKTTPGSSGSYKTAPNSISSYKTPLSSSDEKLQRQQSNASNSGSSCHGERAQKLVDESQKREIFISIETEANAQGRSPISPDSLRHMVGNAQTPIDVLHIENGNEPEHAKFSKISDTEDQLDAELDAETGRVHYKKRLSSTASAAATSPSPNVEANNAKNVIEKMRNEFKQLGEEVGASVRRDLMQRQEHVQQKQQQMQGQQDLKVTTPLTPSPSGDSDELSSLDGYPMSSSHSSRRGASSKLSTDSAYGSSNSPYSLSRQRSSELQQQSNNNNPRTQSQLRPHTASGALAMSGKQAGIMMDASTQAQTNYGTLKAHQRLYAGNGLPIGNGGAGGNGTGDGHVEYSSSSSEHSLPVTVAQKHQQQQQQQQQQLNTNYNYQQQQQTQAQVAYNNNNNHNYELTAKNLNNNNMINSITPTTSQHSLQSNNSNGSSAMSASMKMSKFCHECGGKFILEHAKFCMECGVRRVVL